MRFPLPAACCWQHAAILWLIGVGIAAGAAAVVFLLAMPKEKLWHSVVGVFLATPILYFLASSSLSVRAFFATMGIIGVTIGSVLSLFFLA